MSVPQDLSTTWVAFASFSRACNKGMKEATALSTSSITTLHYKGWSPSTFHPQPWISTSSLQATLLQVLKQEQFSQHTDFYFFFFILNTSFQPDCWTDLTHPLAQHVLGWCHQEGKGQIPHLLLQQWLSCLMLGKSSYWSTSSRIEKHTQLISPSRSAPIAVTSPCDNYLLL